MAFLYKLEEVAVIIQVSYLQRVISVLQQAGQDFCKRCEVVQSLDWERTRTTALALIHYLITVL